MNTPAAVHYSLPLIGFRLGPRTQFPQRRNRQRMEVYPEGHVLVPGVEYDPAQETIAKIATGQRPTGQADLKVVLVGRSIFG